MVQTTVNNPTDHVVVTPPASAKDANRQAPSSAETAVETPTGASPENLQVKKLQQSRSRSDDASVDSVYTDDDSVVTPIRLPAASSSRVTLLGQLANAIPSPDSVAPGRRVMDVDVSLLATPVPSTPPENESRFERSKLDGDSASQETPVKPSKLSFSGDHPARERRVQLDDFAEGNLRKSTYTRSSSILNHPLSNLAVPYAMAPVESYSSVPFDCREDFKESIFPPRPDSEDGSYDQPDDEKNNSPKLVRTLFGWIENSKKPSTPIKAKVLSDRDVGLRHPLDATVASSIATPETWEVNEKRFVPSLDSPGFNALVASKWFGSSTMPSPDEEDDPPHIDHVREAILDALVKKREPELKQPRKCSWSKICFYGGVIAVLLVIIAVASMLLVGRVQDSNESTKAAASGGDDAFDDRLNDDGIFPGGFFSTNNQFCTGAVALERTGVPYSSTTIGSSWDETLDKCGDFMSMGRAAWFVFKATTSELMEASTCDGADFDTKITIASGWNCEQLTCVTFNDQACGDQSRATWYAEAGTTYYISVHGFRDARGDFDITLQPAEHNDQCSSAVGPVSAGSTVFGTTTGGTLYTDVQQCGDVNLLQHPGVWYVLEDTDGWLRAEAVSRHTGFLPQVSVYSGVGCNLLACEGGSTTGSLAWKAQSGQTYYVLVNGLNTAEGDFDLSISWEFQDTCEFATPLAVNGPAFASTTTSARLHDVPACGSSGFHTAPGMWFSVTGTGNLLSATTCGVNSDLDSHISVFRNGCNALQCVGSTGQDLPCGASGAVSWYSELEVEYMIYVSGRGMRTGDFALKVADSATQAGEMCSTAISVGSGTITLSGSTVGASQVSTVCGNINAAHGVWYEVEGSGKPMTIWTCDPKTNFDARVSIFTGTCTSLSCEFFTSASCSELASGTARFETVAGVQYHLLVHGASADEVGSYSLTLSEESSNAACANALPIAPIANTYAGATTGITEGRAVACADGEDTISGPVGVWYTLVGNGAEFSFSTCSEATDFATEISIFTGACFNPECVEIETLACGRQGVATLPTEQGETYYIRVSGANTNESGNFVLSVSVRSIFFGW